MATRFKYKRVAAAALIAACSSWSVNLCAAESRSIAIAVSVLSKSKCSFISTAPISMAIDPFAGTTVSATGSVVIRCNGSSSTASYALSNDSGLYGGTPSTLRMRHGITTSEFLAYSLAYPVNGTVAKNANKSITITASVDAASYQNALPGNYSDTVTLSIAP